MKELNPTKLGKEIAWAGGWAEYHMKRQSDVQHDVNVELHDYWHGAYLKLKEMKK